LNTGHPHNEPATADEAGLSPVVCPHCQSSLRVQDELVGKPGRCPRCEQIFLVSIGQPAPDQVTANLTMDPQTETQIYGNNVQQCKADELTTAAEAATLPPREAALDFL